MKLSAEKTKPVKHLPEVWAMFRGIPLSTFMMQKQKQSDTMTQNSSNTRCLGPESSIHQSHPERTNSFPWTSSQRFEFSLLCNNSKREWNHPPEEFTAFMPFFSLTLRGQRVSMRQGPGHIPNETPG